MGDNAIELQDINYKIGSRQILSNVSLKVKKGSVHGFLGPNGAGKSTTMRILTGVVKANSGEVLISGKKMSPSAYELKNSVGYLPENPPLYDEMTVIEYLRFMAKLRGVTGKKLENSLERVLIQLDITEVSYRLLSNLSRGYRQRVGFAQALIHNPEVIVLDEPTLGLDPHAIVYIRELIQDLASEHSVLLSSHQLGEVEKVCDEVSFIKDGKILASGNLESLKSKLEGGSRRVKLRAYGVSTALISQLKDLDYISYVYCMTSSEKELSTLEVDIKNEAQNQARLVSDLVRYGCSPIEVNSSNNLENYFLHEVRS